MAESFNDLIFKLTERLKVLSRSGSGAGMSFPQNTVLSFIPKEDYSKYTRLTDQSLYREKNVKKDGSCNRKYALTQTLSQKERDYR